MKIVFQDRNLLILFTSTFLFFVNEAILLPTLPVHLAAIGYSNTRIGMVLGAFALGVMVFRPLSGFVTDRKSRKMALVLGVMVFFMVPVFYLVSLDFVYLAVIRFFHGLGITFYTTAMPAFVTDVAPDKRRGEILGHMANGSTLAFACGPFLGIAAYSNYGFKGMIFTCIAAGLINLIVILCIREQHHRDKQAPKISYREVIFKRSILVSAFINLIYAVIFGGIMTFLPVLVKASGDLNVGPFFLAESITIITFRILAAKLVDRMGRGPTFVYSFALLLVAVYLVSIIDTFGLLILVGALFGAGSALCGPSLSALVADETAAHARGTAFGYFYGAFDGGVIMAGVILGYVADLTSLSDMFVWLSISGSACLLIFITFIRDNLSESIKWSLTGK